MLSRGEDFTPLICSRAWLFGALPFHLPTGLIGPAVYGVLLTSLFRELLTRLLTLLFIQLCLRADRATLQQHWATDSREDIVVNSDFILTFGINSDGLPLVADSVPFVVWRCSE